MQIHRAALVVAVGTGLVLAGCTPKKSGLPNAPVFNTGARATIIMPGQNAPPMPGQRSSVTQVGPGSMSGSSTGGGYPGQAGGAPPPGTPPSAYNNPGDLTMLGGAVTVDTREIKRPRNSLRNTPLFWPFAIVAWPFEKIAQSVKHASGGETEAEMLSKRAEAIVNAGGGPIQGSREQVQQDHERAEVEAMQSELARRSGSAVAGEGAAPAQVATAQTAGGGTLSIADELAALRSRGGRGAAPAVASDGGAPAPARAAGGASDVEDRDGDGQPDHWSFERNGKKVRETFDDDGDGQAERTVHFEADSDRIAREEQDTDGDGAPDSWVLHEKGKMSQRRADTNHDGQIDAWTFYDERGQIVRQAADLDGDGSRDRAELFENGKLARRTEDLDGDGQPDRTTRFDAQGNQLELEEDKDGDGQIDVKSYYDGGRLVKRELMDESGAGATP